MNEALTILKRYWNYDEFRPKQLEIINNVLAGKDVLAMLPTGGGKSLTFQIPALMLKGVCIVITPLIALMKDQVANLKRRGIEAEAIYSGLDRDMIMSVINKCASGKVSLLYISPERLASERFRMFLSVLPVSMFAIDEAHCISQWGYDFRPSYLSIADARLLFPNVPVLALTATATKSVADDIQDRLLFKEKNLIHGSFLRENLSYVVRMTEDKAGEILRIFSGVRGCGIVYTRRRSSCEEIAKFLCAKGISAIPYHAGMSMECRNMNQSSWMNGTVRVAVATNAFGMGIDKPDVRAVVHYDVPDSLEAYFQEAGRAGRDGERSYAVLLSNSVAVRTLSARVSKQYPSMDKIREVYDMLGDYCQVAVGEGKGSAFAFDLERFSRNFKVSPELANSVISLLQTGGYLECSNSLRSRGRVMILLTVADLRTFSYSAQQERVLEFVMRSLQGVFTQSVFFSEADVADELMLSREELYDVLIQLARMNVISYVPGDNKLSLVFVEPRMPSSYISLSKEVYEDRVKMFKEKIDAVKNYISMTDGCRQRFLMEYFGMEEDRDCGVCDLCLDGKRVTRSEKWIEKETLRLLKKNGACDIHSLVDILDADKNLVLKVIRDMLDRGSVCFVSNTVIQLV